MNFSDLSMVEAGALFTGTLAFPENPTRAEHTAGALICLAVDQMVSKPEQWGEAPENLRLVCRLRNHSDCEKIIQDATRVISSERLIAAKAAWPTIHAALCDDAGIDRPRFVPSILSKEMIAAISVDLSDPKRQRSSRGRKATGGEAEGNKGNIYNRCIKPSSAVLHLAIALHINTGDNNGLNIGDLLFDGEKTLEMIRLSSRLAPVVAEKLRIDRARQILLVAAA